MPDLVVAASAERQLARLPTKVAPAVVEFMLGPLREQPAIVGKPLRGPLTGLWSARRGVYRIIHRIDGDLITVVRIDHRATAYRL
jgi:mRNA interferase RelE/StbE